MNYKNNSRRHKSTQNHCPSSCLYTARCQSHAHTLFSSCVCVLPSTIRTGWEIWGCHLVTCCNVQRAGGDVAPGQRTMGLTNTQQSAFLLPCMNSAIHYLLSTHSCSYLTHLTSFRLPVTTAASCFGLACRPLSLPGNKFHSQHAEGLTQLTLG